VSTQEGWLLIAMTSGPQDSLRVRVWRELRRLGAVYLHNSVCLLPADPAVAAAVEDLARRVGDGGGRARIIRTLLVDPDEEAQVTAEQQADRDREYGEVIERSAQFVDEIHHEIDRDNATYTEVEESEADLARFERWLSTIKARDYFAAPRRSEAEAALADCRRLLTTFEPAAMAADTRPDEPHPTSGS
jgi:hypothetical protein